MNQPLCPQWAELNLRISLGIYLLTPLRRGSAAKTLTGLNILHRPDLIPLQSDLTAIEIIIPGQLIHQAEVPLL